MTTGSTPQKPFIEWRPTASRNVEVLNETADLYRYFDCTEEPECARHTLEHDLPRESFFCSVTTKGPPHMDMVEMPDRLAENLVMFICQNKGTLSKRPREGEFDTGHHELQRRARSHPALQQCPLHSR